ncbi:AT-hook motif nuclear-localized protein 4 [Cardamine amara subsp. amara]|uniref:AT-hook motif nuclear-localized protein n=1 Tax=Cardamine amara subsp. amara TaxID=228776 RepID=A0ABD1C4I2_CARAN
MDQNESTSSVSVSESKPISPSPSPVIETAIAAPATVDEGINSAKRKRGRPRKQDGEVIKQSGPPKKSLRNSKGDMSMSRGGQDFTPHIFTVNSGEDIVKRIMSFTQNGSRGISVLSANGAVSNVKIQPLDLNRNALTFKDAYEIITLKNSMVITERGRVKNKKRGWKITIGGAEGRIFTGTLAGKLIAASPVQVVIGSYWPMITNPPPRMKDESEAVIVTPTIPDAMAPSSTGQVQQPEMKTEDTSCS